MTLTPDLLIESRYRLLENLGEGATGQVWKAEELVLSRIVALKFVHLDSGVLDLRRRFENEGKVLADLEDPNIVQFLRFSVWEDQPFIVLEYVPGLTLRALLDATHRLPYERALNIAKQMCGAAVAAHARGIVHRDFKPSNIMVSDDDHIKVVDFGIAKVLQIVETGQGVTSSNAAVGSVKYMSPEQCINERLDYRSDIYSIGCILYEMLTGETPFSADNSLAMMQHHLHTPPPPVPSVLTGLENLSTPPDLNAFIAKSMEKNAERRFQSALEARTAIEALQENAKEDLASCKQHRECSVGPTRIGKLDFRVVAAISLAIIVLASSYAFRRARKDQVQPTITSTGNTIRLATILQPRNEAFLLEYPPETRIRYYNDWLKRYPKAPSMQRALAYSYLSDDYVMVRRPWSEVTEASNKATAHFRAAIESGLLSPELDLAYVSIAVSEDKLGHNAAIIKLLTKALATTPTFREGGYAKEAYRLLADAYSKENKYDLADSTYDLVLQLQARSGVPPLGIARTTLRRASNLYNSGATKKAQKCLLRAEEQATNAKDADTTPSDWILWLRERGITRLRMNDPKSAMQSFQESRELAAKSKLPIDEALAISLIAECYCKSGNNEAAMKEYQELSETPELAKFAMQSYVHDQVKKSCPDQPLISDIKKCVSKFPKKEDRQNFVALLRQTNITDLSASQQRRFQALTKVFQEFVDGTQ